MSKFDYDKFYQTDGYAGFAVSAKIPREEADRIFLREMDEPLENFRVVTGYAQYHFGVDDDGEHRHCWWIHRGEPSRNTQVPIYIYERKDGISV